LDYRALVIGADTIVILENEILTKPNSKENAVEILQKLSGKTHNVMTAFAIIDSETDKTVTSYKITEVSFRELSNEEIEMYVASGSPMDKAGAYGIQDDFGAVFVNNINGCYYNVVGLPLEELYEKLKDFANAPQN
jgi:septum formation protein